MCCPGEHVNMSLAMSDLINNPYASLHVIFMVFQEAKSANQDF